MIGTALNHYRITRLLGRGGMGEVYEAEDTTLHRRVALKVLPASVAADPERRQRLEREARAVAGLSHPNIVTLFTLEQAGQHLFLTMELVDGQPLSHLIRPGGLPFDQLLSLAVPIADAVSVAHERGIVHRDLKPDNIMIAADGRPKVLDFGLARLKEPGPTPDAVTTMSAPLRTKEGQVVGTAAYMSPEQAEGRSLDARSDVFSLGIVLFEMATGVRPFRGDTPVAVLSSIVKDPAPIITSLNPAMPAGLARIIRRCLVKDPARRIQTVRDVRNELAELGDEPEPPSAQPGSTAGPVRRWRELVPWGAAIALAATVVVMLARGPKSEPGPDVVSILPPEGTSLTEGEAPQLSPDGRRVAFVATDLSGRTRIHVRDRSALDAQPLPDTDDATQPFWSPDGQSLGFFAGGQLKRVSVSGGRPVPLAAAPVPRGGTWNRYDEILFVPFPEQPPHLVDAGGGTAVPIPIPARQLQWFPSFLPDGRQYVFLAPGLGGGPSGTSLASLDGREAVVLDPDGGYAAFVEPDVLVYSRNEAVVARRLNVSARRVEGEPVTVVETTAANSVSGQVLFSTVPGGLLAYVGAGRDSQVVWFDAEGRRLTDAGTISGYNSLCLSADGRRLVHDASSFQAGTDIWSRNLDDGSTTRLTFERSSDFYAVCSPSGDEIVFASVRTGTPGLFRMSTAVPGAEQAFPPFALPSLPSHWSRDGEMVLYSAYSPETSWDIWVLPLGTREPFVYLATPAEEKNAQLSPDGRWVAYTATQQGIDEVYVKPFPATDAKWQISRSGGRQPQWRPDGKRLFYVSPEKKLLAVDVEAGASAFSHGSPRVIVDARLGGGVERTHQGNPYAISADGRRLLIADAGSGTLPITLVLRWPALLR